MFVSSIPSVEKYGGLKPVQRTEAPADLKYFSIWTCCVVIVSDDSSLNTSIEIFEISVGHVMTLSNVEFSYFPKATQAFVTYV